jgi:hypothetical protein
VDKEMKGMKERIRDGERLRCERNNSSNLKTSNLFTSCGTKHFFYSPWPINLLHLWFLQNHLADIAALWRADHSSKESYRPLNSSRNLLYVKRPRSFKDCRATGWGGGDMADVFGFRSTRLISMSVMITVIGTVNDFHHSDPNQYKE